MIRKMLRIINNEGFSGIAVRVKHRLYLKAYIYKTSIPPTDDSLDTYDFRAFPLTQQLIEQLQQEHPAEFSTEKALQLVKTLAADSTDKVFVMVNPHGETMNYSCVSYGDNYEPRMQYTIKSISENVYIFDCYTFEEHRNKGVQKFSILSLLKEARKKGCKTATCIIDDGNTPSEKAFMRLGFERIGSIATFNLFVFKPNKLTLY